jgi:DNA transformation protein and related proteins
MRMASRDPTVDHLLELLGPTGDPGARRMFGGWGIYVHQMMIALFTGGVAYLKADDLTRADFEAVGSMPFVYRSKDRVITTSYWSLPDSALDSSEALQPWAQRALQAAQRKALAKPRSERKAPRSRFS